MKIKILLSLFLALTLNATAQRHFKGIDAVEFRTGSRISGESFDVSFGAGYSKYLNFKSYYKIDFDLYTTSYFLYKEEIKDRSYGYLFSGSYFYNLINSDNKHNSLFFNIYGGVFAGLETFGIGKYKNRTDFRYPYIAVSDTYKNRLVAGLQAGIEVEYFLSERIGIVANLKEIYSPFRKLSEWETVITVGIKYILY